ncbi:hypothetical protein J6590_059484 [Homalodisca vitripennis]|nr:hypothetical protein J6590_059484 [Homalodisca vitripennis]
MGIQSNTSSCQRKALIEKVRKVLKEMDNAKVENRCCCTSPDSPPEGKRIVSTACLDGTKGLEKIVPAKKDKYVWVPPQIDNRPALDPSYADDTALCFRDNSQEGLELQTFVDINNCVQYFNSLNIQTNSSKSNVLNFALHPVDSQCGSAVTLADSILKEVYSSKFLRILLDRGNRCSFHQQMPNSMKNAQTPKASKARLKCFLAFYSIDEFLAFNWETAQFDD